MTRKYPAPDVKKLYAKSAGRCALATCRIDIVLETPSHDKSKQIGKIAHIVAHGESGPRANRDFPKDKLDAYDNWILLCPTCHDTVDSLESQYTVEQLLKIKSEHEAWVSERLDESMSEVSFAELAIAVKSIASGQHFVNGDFHAIAPDEKIQKNGLTQEVRAQISMGLSRSSEVNDFLVKASQLDAKLPERLKDGFKGKYLELRQSFSGDALFYAMLEFAQSGQQGFKQQAASLAILTYLFHLCEVFEK